MANSGHSYFRMRAWDRAATAFELEAKKPGANQVLFLFDEGTALFAARKYKEAIDVFLKAEKLTEIKDYTSISEEVGTLATSDNVRGYKGEDFEKILVNVYLSMAYAALGELNDAQVEARKINQSLYRMIHEGGRNYQEMPFARYLSAMVWESTRETNDAYIDYKKTYELDPSFPGIGSDLLGTAKKLSFTEELEKWKKDFPKDKARFPAFSSNPTRTSKPTEGEIVILFENGSSPEKVPRYDEATLPRYSSRYTPVSGAEAFVDGEKTPPLRTVLDISAVSTQYLEDRIGRMRAAKLAGFAVKGALAAGLGAATKNEDLGWLAFYAMMIADHADLRSWRTLPGSIEMVRVPVLPGSHKVKVDVKGWGNSIVETLDLGEVNVKAGSKVFLVAR